MRIHTIENLLIGTAYISASDPSRRGVIDYAEKRGNVWVGTDANAYSVRYSDHNTGERYWATVAVEIGNQERITNETR